MLSISTMAWLICSMPALLGAGRGNLGHDIGDVLHAGNDFFHRFARQRHEFFTGAHLFGGTVDQLLDLLRGGGRTLRQVAHFRGDDGETTALLARARRFHGRVQGQDIRLEGDAVDDGDDVADLCDEALMAPMVSTTWLTTPPAWLATCEAEMASWLAWRALSAFWRTVEVISSIVEAVSSREPACCSVRADRSWLPDAISPDAVEMIPHRAHWLTRCARLSRMALIAISGLDVAGARVDVRGQVALGDLRRRWRPHNRVRRPAGQDAAQHQGCQPAHHHHQRRADGVPAPAWAQNLWLMSSM
jgi:hypothetical protein